MSQIDDPVAALARLLDQTVAQTFDFRMNDLVKFFELFVVGEHDAAKRGAVELSVRRNDLGTPARHDRSYAAVPASTARRASTSASMIVAPRSDSICATVDLPLPMFPVSPTRSMTDSLMGRHGSAMWRSLVTGSGPTYRPPSDASTFSAEGESGNIARTTK